jgi:hypothetical protein
MTRVKSERSSPKSSQVNRWSSPSQVILGSDSSQVKSFWIGDSSQVKSLQKWDSSRLESESMTRVITTLHIRVLMFYLKIFEGEG